MVQQIFPNTIVIRGLEISPPIALAPMVGLSHSALRTLVQEEGGIGILYTEMLAARRLPHDNERCSPLLIRSAGEYPLFYQIVTADEQAISRAIEKLHDFKAQGIDLNLGCPAPLQKRQGAGLLLSEDRAQLCKVLGSLRACTDLPVSVKIRLGENLDSVKLRTLCCLLEDEGVDLITIHARLNGEKFCRKPRWAVVAEIRHAVSIPILINGGIFSVDDARKSLEQSGADGLMIGRGAVEKPWLCADIAREIYGIPIPFQPRSEAAIYFKFVSLLEQRFAPERRLGRLKQFTTYYAAPFTFGHHLAAAIQSSDTIDQAKQRAAIFFAQTI
ncbi:MAG: tRNA-dihydrouridine synthase family protein [Pseudomonadota bacterium]